MNVNDCAIQTSLKECIQRVALKNACNPLPAEIKFSNDLNLNTDLDFQETDLMSLLNEFWINFRVDINYYLQPFVTVGDIFSRLQIELGKEGE